MYGDILDARELIVGKAYGGYVLPGGVTLVPSLDGVVRLPGCWLLRGDAECNLTMFEWATVYSQLVRGAPDGKDYALNTMYIEFENNGGAPVSVPSFDRTGGKSYYDGLATDANRDYLRVPVIASTLQSTDTDKFPDGNQVTFFAQTAGLEGVHGKTFSDLVSSRVYGAALVASLVQSDQSQDIVHSRFNFSDADKQLVKMSGSQIHITWPLKMQ